jgi:hypothetical protein
VLTPCSQYPIVAQCPYATPHYHSYCLAALCRTLAAISTALASLLANETTAKCCQTNLLLVAVPCSLIVYGTNLPSCQTTPVLLLFGWWALLILSLRRAVVHLLLWWWSAILWLTIALAAWGAVAVRMALASSTKYNVLDIGKRIKCA